MKKLLCYLKGYEKETVLAPLFKMLEALFELFVPLVMAAVIDQGIGGSDKPYIVRMCMLLIALGVIGLVCSITAQYFAAKAATGFSTRLRHELFAHIQGLSYTEMDTLGTSTLITRMTSDINQVQSGVNLVLRLFLRSPFIVFGAMIMAFTVDAKAALIFRGDDSAAFHRRVRHHALDDASVQKGAGGAGSGAGSDPGKPDRRTRHPRF